MPARPQRIVSRRRSWRDLVRRRRSAGWALCSGECPERQRSRSPLCRCGRGRGGSSARRDGPPLSAAVSAWRSSARSARTESQAQYSPMARTVRSSRRTMTSTCLLVLMPGSYLFVMRCTTIAPAGAAASRVDRNCGRCYPGSREAPGDEGSKKRGRKPAARPGRPGGPLRPGRPTRTIGQFRNLGFVAALVVAVVAAITLIGVATSCKERQQEYERQQYAHIDIPDHTAPADRMTLGRADAPVTIYEYSDFQCPFCARTAAETVAGPRTQTSATGEARARIQEHGLSSGRSPGRAAEAAACADEQGKFWDYHDKLFEEQTARTQGAFDSRQPEALRPGDRR